MLLIGRDIIKVHKVRQQLNGPDDAPYGQKLDLGWVIVGNVCRESGHTPNTFYTTTSLKAPAIASQTTAKPVKRQKQLSPSSQRIRTPNASAVEGNFAHGFREGSIKSIHDFKIERHAKWSVIRTPEQKS